MDSSESEPEWQAFTLADEEEQERNDVVPEDWDVDEEDDDEDEDEYGDHRDPDPGMPSDFYPPTLDPIPAGVDLERSGAFAKPPDHYEAARRRLKDFSQNMFDVLATAEASCRPFDRGQLGNNNLPNSDGTEVACYGSRIYSGQYSDDGTFFYTCAQAFRVYIYDMSVPPVCRSKSSNDTFPDPRRPGRHRYTDPDNHRASLKLVRSFQAPSDHCRWTITDATLSPDNNWIAYSSITPYVHLVKVRGEDAVYGLGLEAHEQEVLDLSGAHGQGRGMGIWSLRFGAQGKELVAGCGRGRIVAFDMERKTCLFNVCGHDDDTNAVCFADKADPNILVSGSDDSYLKVWDRRCLRDARPAGVLVGHTEGVTFVSPKGDGRFIVSNGKDQCAKLWDLRRMLSGQKFDGMRKLETFIPGWDYRNGEYARPRFLAHPQDGSLVTFRGHQVLNTLIRAHFSPPNTTGQRFVASGSADGNIHIWNLDGTTAQLIRRAKTAPLVSHHLPHSIAFHDPHLANPSRPDYYRQSRLRSMGSNFTGYSMLTVRDVSWNPNEPTIMSTAWGGTGGANGSLAMHPFLSVGRRASQEAFH